MYQKLHQLRIEKLHIIKFDSSIHYHTYTRTHKHTHTLMLKIDIILYPI